ncbi:hypothetical protein KP509_10G073600 [Ceratopteris richardii]|nr:hypothetical protein KP509_10G073600 [Ceratopteris richardii]
MQKERSLHPNGSTFASLLKACAMLRDLSRGCELHDEISKKGILEGDSFVSSSLVNMYVKCGSLVKAKAVFDQISQRDVVSWTAMISGYVEHGCGEDALQCVDQMKREKISPNAYTLVSCLKACGSIGALDQAERIYSEIVSKGFDGEVPVGNTLIDTYVKLGLLSTAHFILSKISLRDKVSWTALITGYAEHGNADEVLHFFTEMKSEGICPDAFTYVSSLKACGTVCALIKGQNLHDEVVQKGLEAELLVGNALVDMYAKCGRLSDAHKVFDRLPVRNAVPFTTLITEYAEQGHGNKALDCLHKMQDEGVLPDAVTLVCSLKVCGSLEAVGTGQEIHTTIFFRGLEAESLIGNTLVDMYVKCGLFTEAQNVFDGLTSYDVVSWTALIAGYVEHGYGEEALFNLQKMQQSCIHMNVVTLVCCLKACGSIGATYKGQELHHVTILMGLEGECLIGNMLVDMYVNFGLLAEAQQMFDELLVQDTVSWNTLITGYGQVGEDVRASHLFDRMVDENVKPDNVTFISILNACSHAGSVTKGECYFAAINNHFDLIPSLEHHTCLVDILGRVGLIDRAIAIAKDMPFHPDIIAWHTILGACQKWKSVPYGMHAFEESLSLDARDGAAYICMSNIYSGVYMHEEALRIEALRKQNLAW